jgi:aryl-alcohol dehydrogenase-like predicted oxidoreductase
VIRRARVLGCTLFGGGRPVEGAVTLPGPSGVGCVRYNLLDQKPANEEIGRLRRSGSAVVATGILAGGALTGSSGGPPRVKALRALARPGRTLVQAAIQFVLANEGVDAAIVRCSTPAHAEEALAAPAAEPLSARDLELVFELWANRFE